MVKTDALNEKTDDRAARRPGTDKRAWQHRSAANARAASKHSAPKHSVRLKTDGRHFFFAPSSWSV
jgi:hypothetical protein